VRPRYAHVTLATGLNLLLRMPANADSGKSPPLITFGFFKEVAEGDSAARAVVTRKCQGCRLPRRGSPP
jgi:hypothetical protein